MMGLVSKEDLLRQATALVTSSVAAEVARAYSDQPLFPAEIAVNGPQDEDTVFPDWPGEVRVLALENQGVCAWGLALDGESAGSVVVGGDLHFGETTVVYATSLDEYLEARRWDRACLEREPLLQARAGPLDGLALDALRGMGHEATITTGWPYGVNRRFNVGQVRIMVWVDAECTDWWVSGPEDAVRSLAQNSSRCRIFAPPFGRTIPSASA